jgi:hypothetical protein
LVSPKASTPKFRSDPYSAIELRRRQRAASSVIMDASDILALPVGALARVIARGDVSGESVLDSACSAHGMEHPARDTVAHGAA